MKRWITLRSTCTHRLVAVHTIHANTGATRAHLSTSVTLRRRQRPVASHVSLFRPSDFRRDPAVVPQFDSVETREQWQKDRLTTLIKQLPVVLPLSHTGKAHETLVSESRKESWRIFKDGILSTLETNPEHLQPKQRLLRKRALKIALVDNEEVATARLHGLLTGHYYDSSLARAGYDVQQAIKKVADMRHPAEWYIEARARQRQIHLHIGPTNSGKTYNALKKLEEANNGFYAGPLRLLAHEVYSRFQAKGLQCDLVTGDDVRMAEDDDAATGHRYAATVEMVDVGRAVEVAVIDEIQMMADPERGWAWTRAFLGAPAKELHLCGETRVLPLVKEMTAAMGDELVVHTYERLNPLRVMKRSLDGDLTRLTKGDAVVCFTIVGIHAMKKTIESQTGKRVAIVYGSLPPETRAQQAALFNDPNNDYDYLVASDAIGMGLNLSIKRVIFETVYKFNGITKEQLSVSQIKQIAGRAGRFRTANNAANDVKNPNRAGNPGFVTTLYPEHLSVVAAAMASEAPPLTVAGILPPGDFIEDLSTRLPAGTPHAYVLQTLGEAASVHPRYMMCNLQDQMKVANIIEEVSGLDTATRHIMTMAPFSFRGDYVYRGAALMVEIAQRIATRTPTSIIDLNEIPLELLEKPLNSNRSSLQDLEFLHQSLILFLWLSYRISSLLVAQPMAMYAKEMVEGKINAFLDTYSVDEKSKRLESRSRRVVARDRWDMLKEMPKRNNEAGARAGPLVRRMAMDRDHAAMKHAREVYLAQRKAEEQDSESSSSPSDLPSAAAVADERPLMHDTESASGHELTAATPGSTASKPALPINWNQRGIMEKKQQTENRGTDDTSDVSTVGEDGPSYDREENTEQHAEAGR